MEGGLLMEAEPSDRAVAGRVLGAEVSSPARESAAAFAALRSGLVLGLVLGLLPAKFLLLDLLKTPLNFPTGDGDRFCSLVGGARPVLLRLDRLDCESESTDPGR